MLFPTVLRLFYLVGELTNENLLMFWYFVFIRQLGHTSVQFFKKQVHLHKNKVQFIVSAHRQI